MAALDPNEERGNLRDAWERAWRRPALTFSATYQELDADGQTAAVTAITAAVQPYVADDGSVTLPGSSLVASAGA